VINKLHDGAFELWITNDILLEYEKKITDIFSKETGELLLGAFALLLTPGKQTSIISYN